MSGRQADQLAGIVVASVEAATVDLRAALDRLDALSTAVLAFMEQDDGDGDDRGGRWPM